MHADPDERLEGQAAGIFARLKNDTPTAAQVQRARLRGLSGGIGQRPNGSSHTQHRTNTGRVGANKQIRRFKQHECEDGPDATRVSTDPS
jgi:hypothetical protein